MVLLNRKHTPHKNGTDGYWRVYLYRYGELYQILSVAKGSKVTLVTCPSPYSDDTFYGWSNDPQSTTRTYAATGSFTPTADISLYAIYSYTMNSTVQQSASEQVDIGGKSATLTISDAVPGTTYTIMTGSGSISQGTSSSSSGVTYYPVITMSWNTVTTGTVPTTGTITYTFAAGGSTSAGITVGTSSATSTPTRQTITVNDQGRINYIITKTVSGTFYRVVSHDDPSIINIYSYGVLKKTLTVMEGQSVTLGSVSPSYDDDTFYGYSTSSTSTTRTYTSTGSVTPHGTLNLYVIYSYTYQDNVTSPIEVSCTSGASSTCSYTVSESGTLKCYIKVITGSSSGASTSYVANQTSANFTGTGAYITYNGTRLAITSSHNNSNQFSTSVVAGKVISCILRAPSSGGTYFNFTCPHYEDKTGYRVISHS